MPTWLSRMARPSGPVLTAHAFNCDVVTSARLGGKGPVSKGLRASDALRHCRLVPNDALRHYRLIPDDALRHFFVGVLDSPVMDLFPA